MCSSDLWVIDKKCLISVYLSDRVSLWATLVTFILIVTYVPKMDRDILNDAINKEGIVIIDVRCQVRRQYRITLFNLLYYSLIFNNIMNLKANGNETDRFLIMAQEMFFMFPLILYQPSSIILNPMTR